MEIRKVKISEVNKVVDLIDEFDRVKSTQPSSDKMEEIFMEIGASGGCVVGAFVDEKLVGTCTVNVCPNLSWSGRPYAIIENVIVSELYRNKGVGKSVLTFGRQHAVKLGCYKVALMTGSKKPETLKFYESVGFVGDKTGFQYRIDA